MYIFPYLDNTWVIRVFINNSGKAISRLKIVWDIFQIRSGSNEYAQ